jgi:uncharacterized membrane protein YciS (DUF1049 family)
LGAAKYLLAGCGLPLAYGLLVYGLALAALVVGYLFLRRRSDLARVSRQA